MEFDIVDGLKEIDLSSESTDVPAKVAEMLSYAIEKYVKSLTVSTTVTGSCTSPAGAGTITGTGTGSLS